MGTLLVKYLQKSFTVPACNPGVTQEAWDKIFPKKEEPLSEEQAEKLITAGVEVIRDMIDSTIIQEMKEEMDAELFKLLLPKATLSGGPHPRTAQIVGPLDNGDETDDTPPKETQ